MVSILKQQYALLCSSREFVLNFVANEVKHDWLKPIPEFNGSDVRYLLVHNANVYTHWLANFAMNKEIAIIEESDVTTIYAVKLLFANADAYVDEFLNQFAQILNQPISAVLPRNRPVTATPLEIYTHAFAHEFHHKGQIMTMCRLLGHKPPDTDIIRF